MSDAEVRAYRAWLRRHHPDVGGDRDTFERGLRAWRARLGAAGTPAPAPGTAAQVTIYRRPRGPIGHLARGLVRYRERRRRRRRLR